MSNEYGGEPTRVRLPEEGQILGVVTRLLGGSRLEVYCTDKNTRVVRIPGSFRRRYYIKVGDIVLIEPWWGLNENERGDLIYKYRRNEIRRLKNKGLLKELEQFLDI